MQPSSDRRLYGSDQTIDLARRCEPERIENLEVTQLFHGIIKQKRERRGIQSALRTLRSGLVGSKDSLKSISSLKVLLFDGAKNAFATNMTVESPTPPLLHPSSSRPTTSAPSTSLSSPPCNRNVLKSASNPLASSVAIQTHPIKEAKNSTRSYGTQTMSVEPLQSKGIETQTMPSHTPKIVSSGVQTDVLDEINGVSLKRKADEISMTGGQSARPRLVSKNLLHPNLNILGGNLPNPKTNNFMSAKEVLIEQEAAKGYPSARMGAQPSGLKRIPKKQSSHLSKRQQPSTSQEEGVEIDERLKNMDPKIIESIRNDIQSTVSTVGWDDIAGLESAKSAIMEVVCWPMLRPDLFSGIRAPPKGLLLFGPPGTGKTLIGKCVASSVKATFFSISSSSLTSKWIGEGEKLVKALFAVARVYQPSVVFVDEIDSLLSQRTEGENEATRRIKTEFLVQFDGCGTNSDDRVLVIGATNRPAEIDEAARRRFRKKLYIPLPEAPARRSLVENLLKAQKHSLTEVQLHDIVEKTRGYSGSDLDGLTREASLGPLRDCFDIANVAEENVRPITYDDFIAALRQVRASVSEKDLDFYLKFDAEFGSGGDK